jgi:hypothetical protein
MRAAIALAAMVGLAGCAAPDAHVPPFARVPYEAISRASVVEVALREWRAFGQVVDDNTDTPEVAEGPERAPALWQRVGEYWWLGLNADRPEVAWTGKHDARGRVFPASEDGEFAWSAAFISYVMRIAGAGNRFPFAPSHWEYIDAGRRAADGTGNTVVLAERPEAYAPRPGDIICMGRGRARELRYEHLPAGPFPAHCDIVVRTLPGGLDVVGGNVRDTVAMKRVPTTGERMLATPDGAVLDTRHPWMAVLRLRIASPTS